MKTPYVYCIFRLDRMFYKRINSDLKSRGYKNVKAIIPTISVLKKSRKGNNEYNDVPLLFNYGFLRMKPEKAFDRYYLNKLKRDIPGILSFLKSLDYRPKRKRLRVDNAEDFDDFSLVATCSRKEVRRFKRIARENKKFSVDDLVNVKPGDYLVLRGYPYEGVDATVLEVDHLCKRVKVLIYPEMGRMEVWLPFDNVIYSVYLNHDPDKLYANSGEYDPNQITNEAIDSIMRYRRI